MPDFSESDKIKCLLWCDRHCCLCGRPCGTDIEVAHIDPRRMPGSSDIDNAIPLCYDCHAEIGRYNKRHPRGNKYRPDELKRRRDQVYDLYTQHLVPPIIFGPSQELAIGYRDLPDVGFSLTHYGDSNPIQVLVAAHIFLGDEDLGVLPDQYYSGQKPWRLNPRFTLMGHFSVPDKAVHTQEKLQIDFAVTVIDGYDRHHSLLPMGWVYMRDQKAWYLEP